MKGKRFLALLIAAVLLTGLFAGCSAAESNNAGYDKSPLQESPADGLYNESSGAPAEQGSTGLPESQKWIRTIYLNAETEDLTVLLDAVYQQVAQLEGYIESRDIRNGGNRRYANLKIRIPVAQADAFLNQIADVSNITSTNETLENITLTYVATQSRIQALETEQQRLLELMEQAKTMEDLLKIEERLTNVQYELEKVTSQLRQYDNLVDYATIHLSISEVKVFTQVEEETVWQRISGGFMGSLRGVGTFLLNLLIWILANSPYLVLIGGVVTVVLLIVRKSCKSRKQNQKPQIPQVNPEDTAN